VPGTDSRAYRRGAAQAAWQQRARHWLPRMQERRGGPGPGVVLQSWRDHVGWQVGEMLAHLGRCPHRDDLPGTHACRGRTSRGGTAMRVSVRPELRRLRSRHDGRSARGRTRERHAPSRAATCGCRTSRPVLPPAATYPLPTGIVCGVSAKLTKKRCLPIRVYAVYRGYVVAHSAEVFEILPVRGNRNESPTWNNAPE
jgi:hypothetical protein